MLRWHLLIHLSHLIQEDQQDLWHLLVLVLQWHLLIHLFHLIQEDQQDLVLQWRQRRLYRL